MFHLSLGSKELFHSNFLELLWKQDKEAFLSMINSLLPEDKRIDVPSLLDVKSLTLEREKEHFDVCIYHKIGNSIIYDFIIENKVKSIPYKEQLDKYKDAITKKIGSRRKEELRKEPFYILLSLSTQFAQRSKIEDSGWYVISYGELAEHIMPYYCGENLVYIHDYIEFIRDLNKLEKYITINQNDPNLKEHLKKIRMYDLYCKLSGSMCVQYLYDKLSKKQDLGYNILVCGEIKRDRYIEHPTIFLDSAIASTKETILTATIVNPNKRKSIMFEIQIEGKEYKHMYNEKDCAKDLERNEKIDKNHGIIQNLDEFSRQFVGCSDIEDISGNVNYGKYRPDVVYGHIDMKKYLSEELLNIMYKDILNFCEKISNTK